MYWNEQLRNTEVFKPRRYSCYLSRLFPEGCRQVNLDSKVDLHCAAPHVWLCQYMETHVRLYLKKFGEE
jgi:hypothetical protein